jgi:Asp/Glu/hydantoin racemase
MKPRVALIHTSLVFINREPLLFELFDKILPDVDRANLIDDKMFFDVMAEGSISTDVLRRMCHYVLAAEAMGVDVIFNTCSSLGPAFEIAKQLTNIPTLQIDEAMAEKAAKEGKKIAVVATLPTALEPTSKLIMNYASALEKEIYIKEFLAKGAFEYLVSGNTEKHDNLIASTANNATEWADTIVLAQCSMARLATRLSEETGIPVLSSPRLGVEQLKRVLDRLVSTR